METQPPPFIPPSQVNSPQQIPKKGLGTGAKVGIGCGVIVLLAIVGMIIGSIMVGDKIVKFAKDAEQNPTRATADMMVTTGIFEMVAEDDTNKRYTVKEKSKGTLTTIYWDEKTKAPETISGDFTAIPSSTMTVEPKLQRDTESTPGSGNY